MSFSKKATLSAVLLGALISNPVAGSSGSASLNKKYPDLPEAVASFGAAIQDDWLYVFGGHIGKTHQHSTANLAQGLYRLNLRDGGKWEHLIPEPLLQAAPLVGHSGQVLRIGGLSALNAPHQEEDLHSSREVARFDVSDRSWDSLTPLPEGRSSHDAVVYRGHLYVVGGWTLAGKGSEGHWLSTAYSADLNSSPLEWVPLAQVPFQRRALALAAARGKLYAAGGIQAEGGTSKRVDVYDIEKRSWSRGPDVPFKERLKGFGSSAFGIGDQVYLSGWDGHVYRLSPDGNSWQDLGRRLENRRFFHRMISDGERLFLIAGADRESHRADIEVVSLADLEVASPAPAIASHSKADRSADYGKTHQPQTVSQLNSSNWTGFRGGQGGVTQAADLPLTWSESENLAWRIGLPGYGQSSPVIWGDKAFVTSSAGKYKDTLIVSAIDLHNGRVNWRRRLAGTQKIESGDTVSRSAPTPAVDAQRLYAFFESGDLFAFDHDGNDLWKRSLTSEYGLFQGNHGIGSSLAQTEDALLLLVDHSGPSYLISIDKETGRTNWKLERPKRVSWSTPMVAPRDGRTEIIVSSNGVVECYDAVTARRLWFVEGVQKNTVASPAVSQDLVVVGSSSPDWNIAIKRDGSGDVSKSHVAWKADATSSFGSPIIHGQCVYFVNRAGVASCIDRQSGSALWRLRLGDAIWASPLVSGKHVYFFNKSGLTTVVETSAEEAKVVAENKIQLQGRLYGIAAADRALLLRSGRQLLRLGLPTDAQPGGSLKAQVRE